MVSSEQQYSDDALWTPCVYPMPTPGLSVGRFAAAGVVNVALGFLQLTPILPGKEAFVRQDRSLIPRKF